MRPKRQQWAAEHTIPLGVLTIFAGFSGIGKSTVLAHLIAGWTHGTFDGDLKGRKSDVLLIAAEDDPERVLLPRLIAAGADVSHVSTFIVRVTTDTGAYDVLPKVGADLAGLRDKVTETGARVLVIDPLVSVMGGDSNRLDDVRAGLDPLAGLAQDLGIAVICVAHFNKGGGSSAADRVSGSHAFRDTARSMLLLAEDDQTGERILTVEKSNYSRDKPSYAYRIVDAEVDSDDGPVPVGKAVFLGRTDTTVSEILTRDTSNLGDDMASIVEFVNEHPEGVRTSEVAFALGMDAKKVNTYLGRAVDSGRIDKRERGIYTPRTP